MRSPTVGDEEDDVVRATRFTLPDSVDAWDQWFRWRDDTRLHDRTIDATWSRVAQAVVAPTERDAAQWVSRYVDAFSRWELLPDERLLRLAGTGQDLDEFDAPGAVLNIAAFVAAPNTRHARFDSDRFSDIAALAVHLLDDASLQVRGNPPRSSLRIGVIGFADALHLLGIDYADQRAAGLAQTIGSALCSGTLQAELELIETRGALHSASESLLVDWRARRVPAWKVERVALAGMRHDGLTAIDPHPALALLANCVSDALDPHPSIASPAPAHNAGAPHCSCQRLSREAADAARHAIHAAIQPWIDAPIERHELA